MADHTKFVALAQKLIAKNGRLVTVCKLPSKGNSAQPWKNDVAPAPVWSYNVMAVFLPASGSGLSKILKNKDMLKEVNEVALIAPLDGVALEETSMIVDREQKLLQWVQALQPAEQACLYVMGMQR